MILNLLQSPAFSARHWAYSPVFLFCFLILNFASAQEAFKSPSFAISDITAIPGTKLSFTLNGLPDPKLHGDAKGNLEVQINWTLTDRCGGPGIQRSEKVNIKSTTHKFNTRNVLSKQDERKKLRVRPTGKEEYPAKGFLAAP